MKEISTIITTTILFISAAFTSKIFEVDVHTIMIAMSMGLIIYNDKK